MADRAPYRVVGGFAGLQAARKLARRPLELTLVDRRMVRFSRAPVSIAWLGVHLFYRIGVLVLIRWVDSFLTRRLAHDSSSTRPLRPS